MPFSSLCLPRRASAFGVFITTIALACIASRFVGLGYSPPPMAMDEALGAAHLGCLDTEGTSADGIRWPLFAYGFGGGFYTPVYLYFGVVWTKIFGLSIGAVRGIPAVFVTATVLGVYGVAKRLGGTRLALWALLAASLSPWGFHYARVAWDPPLAPAFLVACVYFWLSRNAWWSGAISGLMFAGAVYSYPATRAQAPLVFAGLFLMTFRWRVETLKRSAAFIVTAGVVSLPLVRLMASPGFMGRSSWVSILSSSYIEAHRGEYGPVQYFASTFLDNLATHLRPSFLFFTGDANLRHSPHHFGELGWLDTFALSCGATLAIRRVFVRSRRGQTRFALSSGERTLLGLSVLGVLFGLSSAALTWEFIPHATRSLGAWPFFSLLTAVLLRVAERNWSKFVRLVAPTVGLAFALTFGHYYFTDYVARSRESFARSYYEEALRQRAKLHREDSDLALYLLMSRGNRDCGP